MDKLTVWAPLNQSSQVLSVLSAAAVQIADGFVEIRVSGPLPILLDSIPALRELRAQQPLVEWSLDG